MEREELLGSLRRRGLDELVVEAVARVARELFVPADLRERAWEDGALPIGAGQTISQPSLVAYMVALLDLRGGERVLDVGTGSGYHAAVLAQIASHVWTIERHEELSAAAAAALAAGGSSSCAVAATRSSAPSTARSASSPSSASRAPDRTSILPAMLLLASTTVDTLGLVFVFLILFPALVTGLIVYAVAQGLGERRANQNYRGAGRRGQDPGQG